MSVVKRRRIKNPHFGWSRVFGLIVGLVFAVFVGVIALWFFGSPEVAVTFFAVALSVWRDIRGPEGSSAGSADPHG